VQCGYINIYLAALSGSIIIEEEQKKCIFGRYNCLLDVRWRLYKKQTFIELKGQRVNWLINLARGEGVVEEGEYLVGFSFLAFSASCFSSHFSLPAFRKAFLLFHGERPKTQTSLYVCSVVSLCVRFFCFCFFSVTGVNFSVSPQLSGLLAFLRFALLDFRWHLLPLLTELVVPIPNPQSQTPVNRSLGPHTESPVQSPGNLVISCDNLSFASHLIIMVLIEVTTNSGILGSPNSFSQILEGLYQVFLQFLVCDAHIMAINRTCGFFMDCVYL